MKTISRQRKKQLSLKALGLCRYSEAHGPFVIRGMCYDCAIRKRKRASPHIPEWWPLSIHYSKGRYREFEAAALHGGLIKFSQKYDAVPEEVFFLAAKGKFINQDQLQSLLSWVAAIRSRTAHQNCPE
jgi:hypothetical protein